MDIQGFIDGTQKDIEVNSDGHLLVDLHGAEYQSLTVNKSMFSVSNQTGITTQAGLSATTPALTLYNPFGSGKNGVLIYAGCVNSVAFAAASVIWLGLNTNLTAAAVTGTLSTAVRNTLMGSTAPTIQALLAATLPAAPIAGPILGVGVTGAITTVPQVQPLGRWFDGSIIIQPGSAVSFQTSTASGASGFFGEFVWAEVDV